MTSMNENTKNINKAKIQTETNLLIDLIETAFNNQTAAHEVEKTLLTTLLKIGYQLMSYLFFLYEQEEQASETIELSNERELKRLSEKHKRGYLSIFGDFTLSRWVYGTREGQKIEAIPMDQYFQLPEKKYSYLLQDWTQSTSVAVPYGEAIKIVQRILPVKMSISALERTILSTSSSATAYFDQQKDAQPAKEGQLIVASADGKGVVIRKPYTKKKDEKDEAEKKQAHTEQKSPKGHFGHKKMAIVGSVYTIDPNPRTPDDVLEALFRSKDKTDDEKDKPARPKPIDKYVRACMERDEKDTLAPARHNIFAWLDQEIEQRDPQRNHPVIMLMDGEEKLWDMSNSMNVAQNQNNIQIIDIIHVSSYVWKAVEVLNPDNKTKDNRPIVKRYVGKILNGQVNSVIRSFRCLATRRDLKGDALKQVQKSANYLKKNAHRMRYHDYLAAGYPIASGVIEGACRHIIVDRMENSGMRWVMSGAKAMLNLRCIYINGSWDQFMNFHIQQEQQSIYPEAIKSVGAANDLVYFDMKVA